MRRRRAKEPAALRCVGVPAARGGFSWRRPPRLAKLHIHKVDGSPNSYGILGRYLWAIDVTFWQAAGVKASKYHTVLYDETWP
jgi:hypothetical protein